MSMRLFASIILLISLLAACAASRADRAEWYYLNDEPGLNKVKTEVEARNDSIERHPAWREMALREFLIKDLAEVPESGYTAYRQYLDNGELYIIVHPAYSVFFHDRLPTFSYNTPVDDFINESFYSKGMRFLQEQERALRDFLEITSTRKRLILLVLPGNYWDHSGFAYRDLSDGFAHYINSVTNSSESVLYLFSEKPTRGGLSQRYREVLSSFLMEVNPRTVRIGGGYLGRCVSDFYRDIVKMVPEDRVSVAGEISAISPEDIGSLDIDDFLKEGRLDLAMLRDLTSNASMKTPFRDVLRNYRNYRNNGGRKG